MNNITIYFVLGVAIVLVLIIFAENNGKSQRYDELWNQCLKDGNKEYKCFSLLK